MIFGSKKIKQAIFFGAIFSSAQSVGAYVGEGVLIDNKYGNWAGDGGKRTNLIDYDEDGREDILIGPDSSGNWRALKNNASGYVDQGVIISGLYGNWHRSGGRIRVIDYNADGEDDILIGPDSGGRWYGIKSNGNSFSNDGIVINGLYGNWDGAEDRIKVIDYDADGKKDIMIGPDSSGRWYFVRNQGGSFSNSGMVISGKYGNWHNAGSRIRVMDYTYDGRDDIVIGPDRNGMWYGLRNQFGSFVDEGEIISSTYGNWDGAANRIKVTDYNSDGADDIVLGPDSSGAWYVLQSSSNVFMDLGIVASGEYGNWHGAGGRIFITDYDADGREDVILGPDNSGDWHGLNTLGSPPPSTPPVVDDIVDPDLRRCIDDNKALYNVVEDSQLTQLYCVGNGSPSGPYWISDLSGIGQLSSLERFAFGGNDVSDLSPVGNLLSLQWLNTVSYAFTNNLNDSDFSSISHLSNLQHIILGSNAPNMLLTGSAFASGFTSLEEVSIHTLGPVECSLLATLNSMSNRPLLSGDNPFTCVNPL